MSTEKKTPTPLEKDLMRRYEQAIGTLVRRMMVEAERRAEMLSRLRHCLSVLQQIRAYGTKHGIKLAAPKRNRGERSECTHLVGAKGMTRCGHMKLSVSRTSSEKAFPTSAEPCGTCARVAGIKL